MWGIVLPLCIKFYTKKVFYKQISYSQDLKKINPTDLDKLAVEICLLILEKAATIN